MIRNLIVLLIIVLIFSCKDQSETKTSENESLETVEKSIDSISSVVEAPTNKVVKKSTSQIKKELTEKGFKTFDYVDEKTNDTILMQQYFMAFLKTGPIRGQNEEEAADLQKEHLAHLSKMYELGYADISGPFGDNGDIRGVTIYNVPTLKMADSLANADPMVKAGRLEIEMHPWWAAKGFSLR
ncbi:YciI family protein [Flavisericum labens]|uniref:YciI family protein n=1 Tax=Flavisericum labens TaxID=3377112 RepID=UPI00387ACBF2